MQTKPIHEAGYNDLMRFAVDNGLDVTHGKTKLAEVREKVELAYGADFQVPIGSSAGSEPEVAVVRPAAEGKSLSANYHDDPKVVVNIASDPLNGGSHHWPICVNGDQILVKRDTDVAIPYRHYLALKNARETTMRQEFDGNNQKYTTIESEQYAVRFSVVDMPGKAEIEAFHERTKDLGREPVKQAA
jgi:hypothetical protein